MLSAGSLNESVVLQKPTPVRDALGGTTITWSCVDEVFAAISAPSGREQNVAQQLTAVVDYSVTIRPRCDVLTTWRVLWGSTVLSVLAVLPSPKKDRTTLLCNSGLNEADQ